MNNPLLYAVALFTALLTAFYMFRLFFLTFTGNFRGTPEQEHHLHESPPAMTIPLIILAILSVIGGFVGIPEAIMSGGDRITTFLAPVIPQHEGHAVSHQTEYLLMGLSTVLVIITIIVAWSIYRKYTARPATGFARVLENKWYVDELYDKLIVMPLHRFGGFLKNVIERSVVDGLVNGVGRMVNYGSRQMRLLQSGQVGSYVLLMVVGMLLVFVIQFFLRKP